MSTLCEAERIFVVLAEVVSSFLPEDGAGIVPQTATTTLVGEATMAANSPSHLPGRNWRLLGPVAPVSDTCERAPCSTLGVELRWLRLTEVHPAGAHDVAHDIAFEKRTIPAFGK